MISSFKDIQTYVKHLDEDVPRPYFQKGGLANTGSVGNGNNGSSRDDEINNIALFDTDSETGVNLYCYTNCNRTSSPTVKMSRGIVFTKDGKEVVGRAFPYMDETLNMPRGLLEDPNTFFENNTCFVSFEGTIIRCFKKPTIIRKDGGEENTVTSSSSWYISTHKKLSADKSKWSSQYSFGHFFKEALDDIDMSAEQLFERLEAKNKDLGLSTYVFLLMPTANNRIVSNPPLPGEPKLYFLGAINNGSGIIDFNINLEGIRSPPRVNTVEEFENIIKEDNWRVNQGVISFSKTNFHTVVKTVIPTYNRKAILRNNEPSVRFRYLQLRSNEDKQREYRDLYPEFVDEFDQYEEYIVQAAENIYKSYIDRFIHKNNIILPKHEFIVMRDCHGWHLSDRKNNKISLEKVLDTLNQQSPNVINRIIRELRFPTKPDTLTLIQPTAAHPANITRDNNTSVVNNNTNTVSWADIIRKQSSALPTPTTT